jgi:hypothetical protein
MDGEQQVAELVWLDPKQLRFFKEKGILRMTIGEERSYWKVQVYRCFPLTDPDRYISVRDAMNREIGLLWEVETDRGFRRFLTRASQEGIEQPEPHRCVLIDLDGNRYYIPDITALDPISFTLLRKWLF